MVPKVVVLFLVLTTLVGNSQGFPWGGVIEIIINLGLRMILNNLKKLDYITLISNHDFMIPEDWNDLALGSLKLENTKIQGFKTMNIINCLVKDMPNSDDTKVETSILVDVKLDQLELLTAYDMDVGILDQIPVYGKGDVKLALSEVQITINVTLDMTNNFSKKSIHDLDIQLSIRDAPSHITGFWKNEKASNILTGAMNILELPFCMWFNYERKPINCAISRILEFVINLILGVREKPKENEYGCIQHSKYNLLENLEVMALHYENGTLPKFVVSERTRRDLRILYTDLSRVIIDILDEDYALKEML